MVDVKIDYSLLKDLIDKKYQASKFEIKATMACKESGVKISHLKNALEKGKDLPTLDVIKFSNTLEIPLHMIGKTFCQLV